MPSVLFRLSESVAREHLIDVSKIEKVEIGYYLDIFLTMKDGSTIKIPTLNREV